MFGRGVTETADGVTVDGPPPDREAGKGGGGSETEEEVEAAAAAAAAGFASGRSAEDDMPLEFGDLGSETWSSSAAEFSGLCFFGSRGSSWHRWPMLRFTQRVHGRTKRSRYN